MPEYKKIPNNENAIEVDGKVILSFDPRYEEYLKWRDENPDLEKGLIEELEFEKVNKFLRSSGRPLIEQISDGLFKYKWLFENGRKRFETYVKNDVFHGKFTSWDESGKKIHEGQFKNGKRYGQWIFYKRGKVTKQLYTQEEVFETPPKIEWAGIYGRLFIGHTENDLVEVTEINSTATDVKERKVTYWESSVKKSELELMGGTSLSYHDVRSKNGNSIHYWKNGNKMCEGEYTLNTIDGAWTWYYSNGKPQSIINYKFGNKDGDFIIFYKNGNIKISGKYKNNRKNGVWLINGKKRKYRNGKEL